MTIRSRSAGFAAAFALALATLAAPAEAHVFGGAAGAGLTGGLVHPFSGLDHLMVALGVGFWAAGQASGGAWRLPAMFVGGTVLGLAIGAATGAFALAPVLMALAVVAIGIVVAFGARLGSVAVLALGGLAALLHGHPHGAELPLAANAIGYATGFVLGSTTLAAVGLAIGRLARALGPVADRAAGSALAAAALVVLVAS
jgi:urease accessory protein